MTHTEATLRRFLLPSDPLDIPEWAAKNFEVDNTSPVKGRYDPTVAPWLNEPLRDFKRAEVESIFLQAGAQIGKTTDFFIALSWVVCEAPGPALWYHNDGAQIKSVVSQRLFHSWENSPKVAEIFPSKFNGRTIHAVRFPACSVNFISIASKANRTGRPCRYVFGDEIKDWEPGWWATVKKRISAWSGLGKVFGGSTPNEVDDDVDVSFKEGHQAHLHVTCPHCAKDQEIVWKNIEWDKILLPDGSYDFDKLELTIRLLCAHCRAVLVRCADPAEEMMQRYTLLRSMQWVAYNPGAPKSKRSYMWSALVNPRVPLRILVGEYLSAKHAAKLGSFSALQDFYNQRLSLPWGEIEDEEGQMPLIVEYKPAEPWSEERSRFLTVDYQTMNIAPAVCWQWSAAGEARFVDFQILEGFAGVLEMQKRLNVRNPCVFIDMRYHKQQVLTECQRYGWRAMFGDPARDSYPWRFKSKIPGEPDRIFRRPVSQPDGHNFEDPAMGTRLRGRGKKVEYFKFSSTGVADVLARLLNLKRISHPLDTPAEYTRQMHAERKVKLANEKWLWQRIGKRANHAWDCGKMQVAAAIYAGFLKMEIEKQEQKSSPKENVETAA